MHDRKSKAKLIILLGIIWIIITLPLPWIINNPEASNHNSTQYLELLESCPFLLLYWSVVWTLKPELTT